MPFVGATEKERPSNGHKVTSIPTMRSLVWSERAAGRERSVTRPLPPTSVAWPGARADSLRIASQRVARFGQRLVDAHERGVPSGPVQVTWSQSFQLAAMPHYRAVYSDQYLCDLSALFADAASQMVTRACPTGLAGAWLAVHAHLDAGAAALDVRPGHCCGERAEIDASIPDDLPIDRIAALVSCDGARALADAASAVCDSSCAPDSGLLEEELAVLRSLSEGRRVIDVAIDLGFSERALYRLVRSLCQKLGVGSRTEAVALAARRGWI